VVVLMVYSLPLVGLRATTTDTTPPALSTPCDGIQTSRVLSIMIVIRGNDDGARYYR